jgi:serine/threonine protein kinase
MNSEGNKVELNFHFLTLFIQPSNIFFAPNGRLKIGDFGLATAFVPEFDADGGDKKLVTSKRHTGNVGTRLYMSPEQVRTVLYYLAIGIERAVGGRSGFRGQGALGHNSVGAHTRNLFCVFLRERDNLS